jgi:hypothetical protein
MSYLRFSRIDRATKTATVDAGDLFGDANVFALGRGGSVGDAHADGQKVSIRVTDSAAWRMIVDGVYTGVEATAYAIIEGGRAAGRALQSLLLIDRPDTNQNEVAMFAKRASPLPVRPSPLPPYLIVKALQEAKEAQFSRRPRPGLAKASIPAGAGALVAMNAALAHPSVSPRLQAKVIASRMRPGPGAPPPDVDSIRAEIEEQHATGQLPDDVAAALLLALDPPEPPTNFTASDVNYDRITGRSRVNYDSTKPLKAAGGGIWRELDSALRLRKAAQALRKVA